VSSTKHARFRLIKNDSKTVLAPWWRTFGFITVRNKNNEFDRINGSISCRKCLQTFLYGSASGTKHFIEHADRCSPLLSSSSAAANIAGLPCPALPCPVHRAGQDRVSFLSCTFFANRAGHGRTGYRTGQGTKYHPVDISVR
jgi:hypothetical protein